eukprot:m.12503 g.12503  ORF g.12503 m.12503 type:complete len:113 (-) comp9334_c0_seq1:737-1075(-)
MHVLGGGGGYMWYMCTWCLSFVICRNVGVSVNVCVGIGSYTVSIQVCCLSVTIHILQIEEPMVTAVRWSVGAIACSTMNNATSDFETAKPTGLSVQDCSKFQEPLAGVCGSI